MADYHDNNNQRDPLCAEDVRVIMDAELRRQLPQLKDELRALIIELLPPAHNDDHHFVRTLAVEIELRKEQRERFKTQVVGSLTIALVLSLCGFMLYAVGDWVRHLSAGVLKH